MTNWQWVDHGDAGYHLDGAHEIWTDVEWPVSGYSPETNSDRSKPFDL